MVVIYFFCFIQNSMSSNNMSFNIDELYDIAKHHKYDIIDTTKFKREPVWLNHQDYDYLNTFKNVVLALDAIHNAKLMTKQNDNIPLLDQLRELTVKLMEDEMIEIMDLIGKLNPKDEVSKSARRRYQNGDTMDSIVNDITYPPSASISYLSSATDYLKIGDVIDDKHAKVIGKLIYYYEQLRDIRIATRKYADVEDDGEDED